MSIGTDAMKRQCDLWLQHKGELISARTTLLRAIGPESTQIHDALREDWTVVWPKGKPLRVAEIAPECQVVRVGHPGSKHFEVIGHRSVAYQHRSLGTESKAET
jgi:hypothetical protein